MNEAFDASQGTQRSDMGMFKKFAMNLTTVAVPNLIAHDLVIVHPMSSMSGYITYIEYTRSTAKGATKGNELIANPFRIGDVDVNYTGATVVETAEEAGKTKWNAHGCFDAEGKFQEGKVMKADGNVIDVADIKVGDDITYVYNNIVVPQDKLPAIKAEMKSIPLVAKARRIAVYYSQIAAYQAKTDYGVDLGDQLAEKAVGELAYEIDTEITNMLSENAGVAEGELVWSKTLPVGVNFSKFSLLRCA